MKGEGFDNDTLNESINWSNLESRLNEYVHATYHIYYLDRKDDWKYSVSTIAFYQLLLLLILSFILFFRGVNKIG